MGMKTNPNIGPEKKNLYLSRIRELVERAEQLGIYVPAEREVLNSNNPVEVIGYICAFANDFMKKSMASGE